jgi:ATP synthase F1 gamma subunit
MPSLKDLKNRIASVKATQKITKAMQMVAAAKLRRAQEAAEAARPMRSAWRGAGQLSPKPWKRDDARADDRHRQG